MTLRTAPHQNGPLVQSVLLRLLGGKDLPARDAVRLFEMLFSGKLSEAYAKSILLLLAKKGETAEELWGAVSAIRKLEKPIGPRIPGLIDTCGTGGDRSQSLNISTLAALVIAGAGCKVAKHGNRAISSRSGSSDLMEAFGIRLDAPPRQMFRAVRNAGIGYFHAPYYHPVFARLQPLRRKLGRRTILNLLGPLVNPMRLDYQLVGVSEARLLPLYATVLARLGRKSAAVCHSTDGMDEVSTAKVTRVVWVKNRKTRPGTIRSAGLGLIPGARSDLRAADPAHAVRIARDILTGKNVGAQRDAVIFNAACALLIAGKAQSLKKAVSLARTSVESGRAAGALKQLRFFSSPAHTRC